MIGSIVFSKVCLDLEKTRYDGLIGSVIFIYGWLVLYYGWTGYILFCIGMGWDCSYRAKWELFKLIIGFVISSLQVYVGALARDCTL